MTGKDVAFVMLFILFMLSVVGNALLLPYYLESDQAERDLRQKIANLEIEKSNVSSRCEQETYELEEENEDLAKEIRILESTIDQLRRELESESGTSISYEELISSLRTRIYDLEAGSLELQGDLNECLSQKSTYYNPHCSYCGHYCSCDPCYHCTPYSACYNSVTVSNVSGIFQGHAYDAVIYVYFIHYPCNVIRIYLDVLDLSTVQIVGVDWD